MSIRKLLRGLGEEGDLGAVLRSARTTFGIRIVATALAYVSMLALARWMGAAEYGIFTYALSWVYLIVMPAGLGIPSAAVRFLPEYFAQQRIPLARGFLGWGVKVTLLTSVAIAIVGVVALQFIAAPGGDAYHIPLVIALAGLPAIALLVLGAQIGRAFGWVGVAYSPSQIWHPLFLLIAAAIFFGSGTPLVAQLMVPASLLVAAACVIVQGAVYFQRLRPRFRGIASQYDRALWLRVSFPLLLLDGFASLINYSDILMVGFFAGPRAVAFYAAASRTAALVNSFFGSINALSGPKMAELYAQGKKQELQNLLYGIAPWVTWPPLALAVFLAVAGTLLLRLFGHGFEAGWTALILLAFANFVGSATGPSALLLNMTGHQDTSARVYGAAAVINVALNAIFVSRFGLTGAALATAISTIGANITLVILAKRKLGIQTVIFTL